MLLSACIEVELRDNVGLLLWAMDSLMAECEMLSSSYR